MDFKINFMANITLYEFNMLPQQEQHRLVHTVGTFLEVLEVEDFKNVLYGLEDFYVELKYDVESNSIKSLRTFKRGDALDRYLDKYQL